MFTGKPLYTLSMSDIGSRPSTIEQNLVRGFEFTSASFNSCPYAFSPLQRLIMYIDHWKALLLFAEADIFLEKRSTGDLVRNGLVSGMNFPPIRRS